MRSIRSWTALLLSMALAVNSPMIVLAEPSLTAETGIESESELLEAADDSPTYHEYSSPTYGDETQQDEFTLGDGFKFGTVSAGVLSEIDSQGKLKALLKEQGLATYHEKLMLAFSFCRTEDEEDKSAAVFTLSGEVVDEGDNFIVLRRTGWKETDKWEALAADNVKVTEDCIEIAADAIGLPFVLIKVQNQQQNIAEASVTGIANKNYSGTAIRQTDMTVTCGEDVLEEGTDYTVTYAANTNPGAAKMVIKGIGDYTGTISKSFRIAVAKTSGLKTSSETGTAMKLSWTKRDEMAGYEVKYSASSTLASGVTTKNIESNKNSLTVSGLTAGRSYFYQVRGYAVINGKKTYGKTSDIYKAVTATVAPERPAVTGGKDKVTVAWKAVSGANGYEVYRTSNLKESFTKVETVSANVLSYVDTDVTAGRTYYYKIRAYRKGTGHLVYSGASTYNYSVTAPSIPAIGKITGGAKKIIVAWDKVSGASGYQLFMATSKTGKYKNLGTFSAATLSYTATGLEEGRTYYFKLRVCRSANGTNVFSDYSAVKYGATRPATPKLSILIGGTTKVVAKWDAVDGASGYKIYMSTKADAGFKEVKSVTGGSANSAAITGLKSNTKYFFKIRAYRNGQGVAVYSPYSATNSSTTLEPVDKEGRQVWSYQGLVNALADKNVKKIEIKSNISAEATIHISRSVIIYGNGYSITGNQSINNLVLCQNGEIELRDLKMSTASGDILVFHVDSIVKAYNCDFSKSYNNDGVSGKENGICYLYNCNAHDNYDEGVSTHKRSYCEVRGGEYYNNGYVVGTKRKGAPSSFGGIHLGGGQMGKVIGAHAYNNCTYGIAFICFQYWSGAGNEVCSFNVVENNGVSGIWCTACRGVTIMNNTIKNNVGDAIHFGMDKTYAQSLPTVKSDGVVTGNTIFGNGNDHVVVDPDAVSENLFINQ